MTKRFIIPISLILLCLIFTDNSAFSQAIFAGSQKTFNTYFMPYYQNWKIKSDINEESINQLSLPLFINLRPTNDLRIWVVDSYATSSYDNGNSESPSLAGISDTKIKASYSMFDRRFLITLGANLPTGNGKLTQDELQVADLLYNEIFGFRVNKLGGGLDINAGLAYAESFGIWGLSLSSSYLRKGSYENLDNSNSEYKPGDEIGLVTAFDMVTGTFSLNGDLGYTLYGVDQIDKKDQFKEGDEIKARLIAIYKFAPLAIAISATDTIRMKNKLLGENKELVAEENNSHGNKIDGNLMLQYMITRNFSITPNAGMTFIAENGYGRDGAFVWNTGGSIQYSPNKNVVFNLNARSLMGNMKSGDLDLSGFETGAILIIRF